MTGPRLPARKANQSSSGTTQKGQAAQLMAAEALAAASGQGRGRAVKEQCPSFAEICTSLKKLR